MRRHRTLMSGVVLASAMLLGITALPATAGAMTIGPECDTSPTTVSTIALGAGQTQTTINQGCDSYLVLGAAGTTYTIGSDGSIQSTAPDYRTMINNGFTGLSLSTVRMLATRAGFSAGDISNIAASTAKTIHSEVAAAAARAAANRSDVRHPVALAKVVVHTIRAPVSRTAVVRSSARPQVATTPAIQHSAVQPRVTANTIKPGTILASPCVRITKANGGAATGETCDVITMVQEGGRNNQDWYIGDQMTTSGHDDTFWNNLEMVSGSDKYPAGNQIVRHDPSSYESINSGCSTQTTNVSLGVVSVSSAQSSCPNGFGPLSAAPTTGHGSKWTGCSPHIVGAPAVDILHSPPGTSLDMTVHLNLQWGGCELFWP